MDIREVRQKQLESTEKYIRQYFENDSSGHDWWHVDRVRKLALKIAANEGGDLFLLEMAALLHDLDDWKLNPKNNRQSHDWMLSSNLPEELVQQILEIIEQVSFKGAGVENNALSLEAKIVQDADRLDAIGAIGVARTFAYGGSRNRMIYDPEIQPEYHSSFDEYKNTTAPTINHFYEKLLLLKDRLNTETAKKLAKGRHQFMEKYLQQFYNEWEGKA